MTLKRLLSTLFSCLPLIITLFVLPIMPDIIPVHYGLYGNVTRYGSKFELLVVPAFSIAMMFFWFLMERIALKDAEKGKLNAIVLYWINVMTSLIFTALQIWFVILAYTGAETTHSESIDFIKLAAVCVGIGYIVIGNLLPKCKRNMLVGIRTKWTLLCDATWYKTHRFGGRLMVVCGVLSVLACLTLFDGIAGLLFAASVSAVIVILVTIYSLHVYKQAL